MSETAVCPNCGTPVVGGTGFGMVACSKCGEFVLVGSDQPKPFLRDATPEDANEANKDSSKDSGDSKDSGPSPAVTVLDVEYDSVQETNALPFPTKHNNDPTDAIVGEKTAIVDNTVVLPQQAPPQFKDVIEFGNQELPSSGFGALVYDIKISGIDTAEIRDDLSRCLEDSRLQLNLREVLGKIKNGELILEKINPVKASVILNRLRHLPFKISWTSQQLIKSLSSLILLFLIPFFLLIPRPAHADDWARHEANLKSYATKIRNMEEDIRELIKKKNLATDPDKRDEMLKDIVKQHQDLMKLYGDFKLEKEHILFEFPEQGDETVRKYKHVKPKTLEEIENEPGLDGQLTRIKAKVDDTYGTSPNAATSTAQAGSGVKPSPSPN